MGNHLVKWVLRVGVFGTFLGHGLLALGVKESWITYLNIVGFSDDQAASIMPVIGIVDLLVAITILLRPWKPVVIYAIAWAFITASMRPIAGEPFVEFVERAANWATPLALYLLLYANKKGQPDIDTA